MSRQELLSRIHSYWGQHLTNRQCGFLCRFIWYAYDWFGFRLIWEKFCPPSAQKKGDGNYYPPSSLFIWSISIYVALFGIANGRYQKHVDRIENRANSVIVLLSSSDSRKDAFPLIADAQLMPCPLEPQFTQPVSVFRSIFLPLTHTVKMDSQKTPTKIPNYPYEEGREVLRKTVVAYKSFLRGANLSKADLIKVDLGGADLTETNFSNSNLSEADLIDTQLQKADLEDANLEKALLLGANLDQAALGGANLQGVFFTAASLHLTNLVRANLRNSVFAYSKLVGAVLINSDLGEADFEKADLTDANLMGANLANANLKGVNFTDAFLSEAVLTNAYADEAHSPEAMAATLLPCATLYKAQLDSRVEEILRRKKPELFSEAKQIPVFIPSFLEFPLK